MAYTTVRTLQEASGNVLRDVVIGFHYHNAKHAYPEELRLVETRIEVDGQPTVMAFITNNLSGNFKAWPIFIVAGGRLNCSSKA